MPANRLAHRASECDAIRDLIPDYAFGLTDHEETRLVEANLRDCLDAAEQLEDYRNLQTGMRLDVPQMMPPARLEARLMAAIAAPERVAKPRRRAINWRWTAAAVAILALVISNLYWFTRVDDLTRRENSLTALLGNQQNGDANGQHTAFVLTSTSGLHWVRLPASEKNGDASAFLMWNAESKIGLMYARGFPQLSIGKAYQLWLTRGQERVSVGTFQVDADGKGALLFNCADPIDKYTWARITVEPINGSATPTGAPIVIGELST